MSLVERYLFRQAAIAFLTVLTVLTTLVWITQVLRVIDVVTSKGQTLIVFLTMTVLALPPLISTIAPVALFIAALTVLNRVSSDSELVVMSASGISGARLLRPFLVLALLLSGVIAANSLVVQPIALRELRQRVIQIQSDLIGSILKEGQFVSIASGLTFHIRSRDADGALRGIFVQDTREAGKISTYIAERGAIANRSDEPLLVLEKGSVQRQSDSIDESTNIVLFDRYVLNLAAFQQDRGVTLYEPSERYTTELIAPDPADPVFQSIPGRFRSELFERLVAPLYPVAFMCIAVACVGTARTTRQGRGSAVATAIATMFVVRGIGFAIQTQIQRRPELGFVALAIPVLAAAGCGWMILFNKKPIELYDLFQLRWPFVRRPA